MFGRSSLVPIATSVSVLKHTKMFLYLFVLPFCYTKITKECIKKDTYHNKPCRKRNFGKVRLTTSFHQKDHNHNFLKECLKQKA